MQDDFLKRMNSRLAERGIKGRQDLELHDAKVIEEGRAVRVLATYSPLYGPPSVFDVAHWVQGRMGEFGNEIVTRPDTISAYPEKNFVTFIVEQKTVRQPLVAAKGMIKAGVDQYLDGDSVLWEVVKAEQGPAYIVRKDGVSVERMLEIRKQALRGGMSGRKHVMLANLDAIPSAGGGYATVDVGDIVDFYANSLIHRGKVQSAGASGVKIQVLAGNDTYTVDPMAITNVIEKSAAAGKQQDDVIRRYFSLQYPGNPEMVEKISPTSSAPVADNRPRDGMEIIPIKQTLDASVTPPATGGPALHPTQRVLGKLPATRAAQPAAKR